MTAVLVTGPTVMQDLPFSLSGGRIHSQYSFLPTRGGMVQAKWTRVPGSMPRWFTHPKMVTHPGNNRARHRITKLIESNVLLLSQIGTIHVYGTFVHTMEPHCVDTDYNIDRDISRTANMSKNICRLLVNLLQMFVLCTDRRWKPRHDFMNR